MRGTGWSCRGGGEDEGIVPRSLGEEYARAEDVSTRRQSQPDGVPTYDESLFYAPVVATTPTGPGPIQGGYKEIVVSISQQYMWAYEDGATVMESYVSTGTAETLAVTTPVGYWSILTKVVNTLVMNGRRFLSIIILKAV